MNVDKIYTVKEAAKELRCSPSKLYQMVKRGEFPTVKMYESGEYRICGWHIKQWLDERMAEGRGKA